MAAFCGWSDDCGPVFSLPQANVGFRLPFNAKSRQRIPEAEFDGEIALQPLPEFITVMNKTVVYLLFLGSLILFLIASVNLASMLVMKAVAREGEIAIRVALGASRGQLQSICGGG